MTATAQWIGVCALFAVLAACADGKRESTEETVQAPAKPAPRDSGTATKPPADAVPAEPTLPALDVAAVSEKQRLAGVKHNSAGLRLHRAGEYAEAIEQYRQALTADPGNLLARYNLASVYVTSEQVDRALEVLGQFAIDGCDACTARLIRARSDKEWAGLRENEKFKELTANAKVNQPPWKEAAKDFAQSAANQKLGPKISKLIHPRRQIKVIKEGIHHPKTTELLVGRASVEQFLRAEKKLYIPQYSECTGRCCSSDDGADSLTTLLQICYAEPVKGVRYLDKLLIEMPDI
jgi:tetratricopeptide (TPR) repeat protein